MVAKPSYNRTVLELLLCCDIFTPGVQQCQSICIERHYATRIGARCHARLLRQESQVLIPYDTLDQPSCSKLPSQIAGSHRNHTFRYIAAACP